MEFLLVCLAVGFITFALRLRRREIRLSAEERAYLTHRTIAGFAPLMPSDGSVTPNLRMEEIPKGICCDRGWYMSPLDLVKIVRESAREFESSMLELASQDPTMSRSKAIEQVAAKHGRIARDLEEKLTR